MEEITILKNKTLLFHHHEVVYVDRQNKLWMSSPIGRWLDELSFYFEEVHLLLFTEDIKKKQHDMYLTSGSIKLIDLGSKGNYFNFFSKRKRVLKECNKWSGKFDYFMIRGFTSLQNFIWFRLKVKQGKIFYLVRSLKQPRTIRILKPLSFIAYLSNFKKEILFKRILNSKPILISNSILIANELQSYINNSVGFAPSNILSSKEAPTFSFNDNRSNPIFNFLFVGRVSKMKGFEELIESLMWYKKQISDNFIMHIVGDMDQNYYSAYKPIIESYGLTENVIFHGRLSFNDDLFKLYASADVFILPSHSEGFPRVIWEAALFSCPLLVTDVGGIPSFLKHKVNAYLIKPQSVNDLFLGVKYLTQNYTEQKEISQNAYELALQNTLEKGVEKLIEFISRNTPEI